MANAYSVRQPVVLADAISGGLVRDVGLVLGAAAFVGAAAQASIPLPFTPVPLTLQTFAVLLSGAALGSARGLLGMSLYLVAGGLGVPWFAGASSGWGGASFGYIVGFVVAAGLVGHLAERGWDRSPLRMAAAMLAGTAAIIAIGTVWLAATLSVGLDQALELGVYPFLAGDVIKVAAAAGLLPAAWRLVNRR